MTVGGGGGGRRGVWVGGVAVGGAVQVCEFHGSSDLWLVGVMLL